MNLLLVGAPGSGKGTMSEFLVKEFGLTHISTGDMLRQSIANKTEVGLKAQTYMNVGQLVPDYIIHDVIVERFSCNDFKVGFLMDGYPRTLPQAEDLDQILKSLNNKIDLVINLDVAEEVLLERITGRRTCSKCKAIYHIKNHPPKVKDICDHCGQALTQRVDDTAASLKTRLIAYNKLTKPIIAYYHQQGLVVTLNGNRQADCVYQEIVKLLKEKND